MRRTISGSSSKVTAAAGVTYAGRPAAMCSMMAPVTGPPPMLVPVSTSGLPADVASRILPAAMTVGAGMTICTEFSTALVESNKTMSWVPVPTSIARIRTCSLLVF